MTNINNLTDDELMRLYDEENNKVKALREAMKRRKKIQHKMDDSERKVKSINFRVTQNAYDELSQMCEVLPSFKSPNEVSRSVLMEWLDKDKTFIPPRNAFDPETFELLQNLYRVASELRNDIRGMAVNYNQAVKHLNTLAKKQELTNDDIKEIKEFNTFRKTLAKEITVFNKAVGKLCQLYK